MKLIIKDFKELEKLMTEKQKLDAQEAFERVYPKGTSVVMCTSEADGEDYLKPVDIDSLT